MPLGQDTSVVDDAGCDPVFADNPLVVGQPLIRFYAGQPINHQGSQVGTLCAIDSKPREFSSADHDSLKSLAQ